MMQKFLIPAAFGALVACGVPPEEDKVAQGAYKPMTTSLFVPVDAETLNQSQAWVALIESYE